MKRILFMTIALLLGLATSHAQMDLRQEWSRGNAFWRGTVYSTSVKVALPAVGHGVYGVQISNRGKVGGGTGYLYAGQIFTGGRVDTSTTPVNNWQRAFLLYPAVVGGIEISDWYIQKCTADTIWLKSTDSVYTNIYVW